MTKKILTIVLIAAGAVALIALLWWWFLNRQPIAPSQTGTFGSGQTKDVAGTGDTGSGPTNIGNPLASTVGSGNVGSSAGQNGIGTAGGGIYSSAGQNGGAISGVPGVVWVSPPSVAPSSLGLTNTGGIGGSSNGSTQTAVSTVFNPTPVNGIRSSNPTGGVIPSFGGGYIGNNGNSGPGLAGSLIGAGLAGAVSCSGFLLSGILGGASTASLIAVQVNDGPKNSEDVLDCIARRIAQVTLQQITASTVNWINSGFNGSPTFVQNQRQFFTNVADQAAGQFIQGSALAFLCSPFQLQVKIAIAQSYAYRNAPSCTLSQVVGNINNFMNGTFSAGGWRGLLSFTTMPTNNPYGSFLYGSIQLNTAVSTAVTQEVNDVGRGQGFLDMTQLQNCSTYGPEDALPSAGPNQQLDDLGDGVYRVCDKVTVTPGSVIASSLNKTLGESQDSLNLAKSFDEIISALISQLMTNVLYNGLSNVSGAGGYQSNYYTPDQQQAISQARGMLTQMQTDTGVTQQYGNVQQGSISDLENAQSQVQNLVSCWNSAATAATSNENSDRAATAKGNAATAQAQFDALSATIATYNNNITRANATIALLESLQSRALSADSTAKVNSIQSDYAAAKAAGNVFTQADVTTAQQNRQTLQAQMAAQNQQTANGLQQCNAFN